MKAERVVSLKGFGIGVVGVLLAACAANTSGGSDTSATTRDDPPTTVAGGLAMITPNVGTIRLIAVTDSEGELPPDTVIWCRSGPSFPYSALDQAPLLTESDRPEIEEAIKPFLESEEGVYWPQAGWRVLYETDDRVIVVNLDSSLPETSLAFMTAERRDGSWQWAGASSGGSCPLMVKVPEGVNTVDWRLDPSAEPMTTQSTTIHLLVTEWECASGQAMGDRLLGPEVLVTEDEVMIAFAANPLSGAQTCPGNPEQPVMIELSGPIGDREVVDGLALDLNLEDVLVDQFG